MRGLKTLVIVLGALIVVSMGLLAYGFYTKLAKPGAPAQEEAHAARRTDVQPAPPVAGGSGFGELRLDLPPGCSVVEMRPEGGRLYLRTGPAGACERIVVLEAASGHTLGTITLRP